MKYEKNGNDIELTLPCGKKSLISEIDLPTLLKFDGFRFAGNYLRVHRYIKTEFGSVKEEYYFHRIILNFPKGFEIDHINRNKLDNRRENLRLASRGENSQNKNKAKNCVSKYRGVGYRPRSNKLKPWVAYISKDGIRYELGYFSTEKEAALSYNKKALELWDSFAFQNEIE